ncbi:hypothetical protein C1645_831942 [Glomus cerebriforme]|uniref:Uncharacterized protein n=1 Tax=Glomus cerebriforme TaxID=658196 RepID=A0A397SJ26_9GLOM|nr:hypothetical protein C1645_831942 [Glomus cerebriforme]
MVRLERSSNCEGPECGKELIMFGSCDVEVKLDVFDGPPGIVEKEKLWSEEVELYSSIDNSNLLKIADPYKIVRWEFRESSDSDSERSSHRDEIGILLDAVTQLWIEELQALKKSDSEVASITARGCKEDVFALRFLVNNVFKQSISTALTRPSCLENLTMTKGTDSVEHGGDNVCCEWFEEDSSALILFRYSFLCLIALIFLIHGFFLMATCAFWTAIQVLKERGRTEESTFEKDA